MKLYIVVVHDLRVCMKEDNPGLENIKGDHSKEIIICEGWGILYDSTHSSSLFEHTMHDLIHTADLNIHDYIISAILPIKD